MPSLPPIRPEDEAVAARLKPEGAFDAPADAHDPVRAGYCLRLGDDALILGQRLSEWTGHAPSVEVDLSLANMALDLVGQATLFLGEAGDADELAFKRDVLDFRNCLLVEQPNGDFARTMVRHLLFTTFQHMLFERLVASRDKAIAGIAAKGVKELAYHRELAADWVIRLGDGTEESHARTLDGLDWCWRFVPELFEVDGELEAAIAIGIAVDPRGFEADYREAVGAVLAEATLPVPPDSRAILGGRRGHHSEHLGHLLAIMQYLPRTYPDAVW
ncbi:1,2-phenylacetyl-CoA epoxidase subunit PaaC [Sphingomonas astaxanthinifaciens]|uniref:Phenylacetic acid degradation protein n=1 Tax=Sphingomonas astaxanthinifaciens DSM 22298 TaxID=1123267 RepID=A0ABQ5Z6Y8_9SPHN|nr:1,2-phenylacetyl-CoA epoxidase subunit PaaC [Sphingomonas astaxanthinifaciens]GLR46653.1 phenylacetic acid degradation protein [Sphingomonas astaxanthinifaciens DSM 22298]